MFAACTLLLAAPLFLDQTSQLGLALGDSAACWVDLDGDGWTDLVAGGNVWFNEHGKKFVKAGAVANAVAADFDNDGLPDLFSWSELKLYQNKGDRSFAPFPLPDLPKSVSRGACWGDFDNDGFADLYVGGYEDWDDQVTYPSFLLMNKAGKSFELAWSAAKYRSRGVTACDFDRDGDLDVYVSNYRLQPNQLFLNDGHGHFADEAAARNAVATSPGFDGGHSIGAAWSDFDNDGQIDLFAGNFAHRDDRGDQPKSRFLRNVAGTFEDKGTCGVFYQESYATPTAGDYDNDGDVDLFFTTVYATASFGVQNHAVLYRNEGSFVFTDQTTSAGVADLGPTYQAAWADFDQDGDLDIATNGRLFVNQSQGPHWLEVRLVGPKGTNRSAIGAQVRIKIGASVLTRQVEAGTGEGNQNDLTLHFGLGAHAKSVALTIVWPGGKTQTVKDVHVDQILTVRPG
jgi:hypothetical protein